MTTFEVGKKYKTGSGDNIWTCIGLTQYKGVEVPILLNKDGINLYPLNAVFWNRRLWVEYKEPVTVEGWVNVYGPPLRGLSSLHKTLAEAEETARIMCSSPDPYKLIATVYVKGTSNEP